MDYQKARKVRSKSLLSLINEQKFQEGKGIGASIGGAISNKFKAKAVGIKESLDPLNWVRKATGKGAIGDFAVSSLGRLFGRSNRDIKAFGGIGRPKVRAKKDPQFTTISAGQNKPIKRGDGIADILAKMYNFMLKNEELHKMDREIDKTFRQEEMDEDQRRHEHLVDAIKKYIKVPKTSGGDNSGPKGLFDFIWDFLKKNSIVKWLLENGSKLIEFFEGSFFVDILAGGLTALLTAISGAGLFLTVAAAGALFNKYWTSYQAKKKESNISQARLLGGTQAEDAAKQLEEMRESGEDQTDIGSEKAAALVKLRDDNYKKRKPLLDEFMKQQGFEPKIGFWQGLQKNPVPTYKNAKGEEAPQELLKQASDYADEKTKQVSSTTKPSVPTPTPVTTTKPATGESSNSTHTLAPTPAAPVPQPVSQSANPPLPVQASADMDSTNSSAAPVVSVNNNTTNIGGQKPKIMQASTAKPRNSDLYNRLRDISVPV